MTAPGDRPRPTDDQRRLEGQVPAARLADGGRLVDLGPAVAALRGRRRPVHLADDEPDDEHHREHQHYLHRPDARPPTGYLLACATPSHRLVMLAPMTDTTDATATTAEPAAFATAADLGTELRQRAEAIRANPHLGAVERGQALAELDVEHGRRLEAIKVADRTALAEANAARWIAAFGSPPDQLDRRHAADDFAMQLDSPDAALAALDRADLMGDEVRARAIAEVAFGQVRANPLAAIGNAGPWGPVLAAYRSTRPEADAALAELLPTDANPRRSAIARRMGIELRAEASR